LVTNRLMVRREPVLSRVVNHTYNKYVNIVSA